MYFSGLKSHGNGYFTLSGTLLLSYRGILDRIYSVHRYIRPTPSSLAVDSPINKDCGANRIRTCDLSVMSRTCYRCTIAQCESEMQKKNLKRISFQVNHNKRIGTHKRLNCLFVDLSLHST